MSDPLLTQSAGDTVPPQLRLSPVDHGLQAEERLSLIMALLGPMPATGEFQTAVGLAHMIACGLDGDMLAQRWAEVERSEPGWYVRRVAAAMEER